MYTHYIFLQVVQIIKTTLVGQLKLITLCVFTNFSKLSTEKM